MSQHPVFLIVHAKLAEAAKAVSHMNEVHAQQCVSDIVKFADGFGSANASTAK